MSVVVIVAIFVACSTSLLNCVDLPFNENLHVFGDPDRCRAFVEMTIKKETEYRINDEYPIVLGHCVQWCKNCGLDRSNKR